MAYDTSTAERVRALLSARSDVVETPIVGGGLGFMVGGHLACGVSSRGLTVRVGPEGMVKALRDPRARPLVIGGRATAAFVVVESDGYHDDEMLRGWLEMTLRHLATSPSR